MWRYGASTINSIIVKPFSHRFRIDGDQEIRDGDLVIAHGFFWAFDGADGGSCVTATSKGTACICFIRC
ncbi:hypothetical protein SUGI_0979630 [Cryptomeria japonica]|nr:hypothetical protein SUGI_0979630 [Cryptomeria japonica]